MENKKKQLIGALSAVGEVLIQFGNNSEYESFSKLVDKAFYNVWNCKLIFLCNIQEYYT